jgi:hypothetical protein
LFPGYKILIPGKFKSKKNGTITARLNPDGGYGVPEIKKP